MFFSGLINWDVKGRNSHVLTSSPQILSRSFAFLGENWGGEVVLGWLPIGGAVLCLPRAKMSLGLQPQGGGILVGAHSAHPINLLYVLCVTDITNLSIFPAVTEKERPSGRKQEERKIVGREGKKERERKWICVFLPICEFTEMLAFVPRKTFHVSAPWWVKLNRSGK